MKLLGILKTVSTLVGEGLEWLNNKLPRSRVRCIKSAKMISFWWKEYKKPKSKYTKEEITKKIDHYVKQFDKRENSIN